MSLCPVPAQISVSVTSDATSVVFLSKDEEAILAFAEETLSRVAMRRVGHCGAIRITTCELTEGPSNYEAMGGMPAAYRVYIAQNLNNQAEPMEPQTLTVFKTLKPGRPRVGEEPTTSWEYHFTLSLK